MTDFNSLFVQIVSNLSEEMKTEIQRAKDRFAEVLGKLPAKLNELVAIKALELDCTNTTSWNNLDDDKIVSIISSRYCGRPEYNATIEDLRKLRQEFGEFTANEDHKEIEDADAGTVRIPVEFKEPLTTVRFYIVKTIPADAKCKIVKTTRVIEDTALVCSNK